MKRHPVTPIAPQCSSSISGHRCPSRADVWIYAPGREPVPGGAFCRAHGEACVAEYAAKLGERWTLQPLVVPCEHRRDPRACDECPVVQCGCGRSYAIDGFRALPGGGHSPTGIDGVLLEMRHCVCGSTRSIHVDEVSGAHMTGAEVDARDDVVRCAGCEARVPLGKVQWAWSHGPFCATCHSDHPITIARARADMLEDD